MRQWPERLEGLLPTDRLDIVLSADSNSDERFAELTGYGDWAGRLAGIPENDSA